MLFYALVAKMFYYERTTYHEVAWSYVNASDRTSLYADITVSIPGYLILIILKIPCVLYLYINLLPIMGTLSQTLYETESH